MTKGRLQQMEHNNIGYSNCWEDAGVLLKGLNPVANSRIVSIGSAGDNSFFLLTTKPQLVMATDINPLQLALIHLKKQAIKELAYNEFIAFLGFEECDKRIEIFHSIKAKLERNVLKYWENHLDIIRMGIINCGKLEKYFQLYNTFILPLIHSKKTTLALIADKSDDEQKNFYHNQWNNWKWRGLFALFFSRFVMGRLGRNPAFLNEVRGSVAKKIFAQTGYHLQSKLAQSNHFLRFILTGSFGELLPHYARRENFETIKQNIDQLEIIESQIQNAIARYRPFQYCNLSNIFEYMDASTTRAAAQAFKENLTEGAKLAYWNLMVPRRISEIAPTHFTYLQSVSKKLTASDKGFFYKQFIVDERK